MGQENAALCAQFFGEDGVNFMDLEFQADFSDKFTQQQEQLVERLQPASELEERLVRYMALCEVKLNHIIQQLTQIGERLHHLYEEFTPETL